MCVCKTHRQTQKGMCGYIESLLLVKAQSIHLQLLKQSKEMIINIYFKINEIIVSLVAG